MCECCVLFIYVIHRLYDISNRALFPKSIYMHTQSMLHVEQTLLSLLAELGAPLIGFTKETHCFCCWTFWFVTLSSITTVSFFLFSLKLPNKKDLTYLELGLGNIQSNIFYPHYIYRRTADYKMNMFLSDLSDKVSRKKTYHLM